MSSNQLLPVLLSLGVGYLMGSVPFGLLLTKAAGLGDVRKIGSGNIGATNVLRTGNKGLAAATLLLDMLKGTAAVLLAWYFLAPQFSGNSDAIPGHMVSAVVRPWVAGLGAILGHVFPVWLGFKGGKGVATYIGVLLGAAPIGAAVFCGVWLATALLTRYSSLSALIATLATFVYFMAYGGPFVVPILAVMSALLFWKHRENIQRLVAGKESRIGAKG